MMKGHVMHSKSDNIEIMMNDETGEIIEELFDSLGISKQFRIDES